MGDETSKSIQRRLRDPAFADRYFVGHGIDIGAGGDGKYGVDANANRFHRISP